MESIFQQVQVTLGPLWPLLIFGLILLLGYLVAKVVEALVRAGLRKTQLDDRFLSKVSDQPTVSTEQIGGRIAFWVVLVLAFIVAFDAVNLATVSGPLGVFVERVLGFIPNLIAAVILALVAYVVARVLQTITTKALEVAHVDDRLQRLGEPSSAPYSAETSGDITDATPTDDVTPPAASPKTSLAKTLGDVVFYFVLLLFLPAVLDALSLGGILGPVQGLINEVLAFLPNLLLAGIIIAVGMFVAKVLRNIVTGLLAAAGADQLSERVGLNRATGGTSLSSLIGLVVYILVLVPVIVAALNALDVEAVTGPASDMLAQFMDAIPRVFVAAVILGIAFVVGRLLAGLVASLLAGVGFNRLFEGLGFSIPSAPASGADPNALDTRTPAGIAGWVVLVAVMLFAATEAASALGLDSVSLLVTEFTILAGKILLGLLIFGVGLYLANLAYSAVRSSGTSQAAVLAVATRVSILVLAAAMALKQMGLADSIINLAFGLLLGAVAVAAAIAYGLGGRDVARQQLERLQAKAESGELRAPDALAPRTSEPSAGPGSAARPNDPMV